MDIGASYTGVQALVAELVSVLLGAGAATDVLAALGALPPLAVAAQPAVECVIGVAVIRVINAQLVRDPQLLLDGGGGVTLGSWRSRLCAQ